MQTMSAVRGKKFVLVDEKKKYEANFWSIGSLSEVCDPGQGTMDLD